MKLRRKVALKVLPKRFIQDPVRVKMFEREARAASALNHPNIITIFDIGQFEGAHFIATEYIEGQTVRQRLRTSAMPLREAIDVAVQTASALAAAHEAGIVHRDIKPENVMVRRDGIVKVLDFGLAKLTEPSSPAVDTQAPTLAGFSTETEMVMGTPCYMSPEQARGGKMDARTDIFSLGVMLYEMVTGHAPFAGATTSEVIAAILRDEPQPLTSYAHDRPQELERIVGRALCKTQEERYQNADHLLAELKRLRRDLEFAAAKYGERERPTASNSDALRETRTVPARRYLRDMIVFVATLVIAATAVGVYRFIRQNQAETDSSDPFAKMTIKRLTYSGKATRAAISPDGNYVAYVVGGAGKQLLLVRQVAGSNAVPIVPLTEVVYRGMTFSRDGRYVYYVVQEQNNPIQTLYRVPALGGRPRKILKDIASPVAISPDNTQIAFVRRSRGQGEDALIIANIDGADERKLASRKGADFFSVNRPAWSPDSRVIACAAGTNTGGRRMYITEINVADGREKQLSPQPWSGVGCVSWMRDGQGLIIDATDQGSMLAQIWHVPNLTGNPQKITNDLNDYRDMSLADDSRAMVTVQSEAHINVWLSPNAETHRAIKITDGVGQYNGGRGLTWTPDGRLAYVSRADGSQDIWLMDWDGTNQIQLTTPETGADLYPTVTPDGRYIVFVSTRTGNSNLYRYELSTGDQKQLTNGIGEEFPAVSSDSKWVIYTATGSINPTLWKVPIDGGEPAQLTDRLSQWPAVSPDGRKIACWYRAEPQARWQIAIFPISGGVPERVFDVQPTAEVFVPIRWMPDGGGISFADTRHGVSNIWRLPVEGSAPNQLTNFISDQIFWFDWSLDGKQLACSRGTVMSDVVLITGFK